MGEMGEMQLGFWVGGWLIVIVGFSPADPSWLDAGRLVEAFVMGVFGVRGGGGFFSLSDF